MFNTNEGVFLEILKNGSPIVSENRSAGVTRLREFRDKFLSRINLKIEKQIKIPIGGNNN